MTHIYSIYKVTNLLVPNKYYIGFDSNWPSRMHDHKRDSLYETHKKYDSYYYYFHQSVRKYGWEGFEWEVIYQSYDKFYTLKKMEPYFIKEYNSYYKWENGGYNLTLGGEGSLGHFHSQHTIDLIKIQRAKQVITEQHKINIGLGCQKDYCVFDPCGNKYLVHGLKKFCSDHNLCYSVMLNIVRAKKANRKGRKTYKGWSCDAMIYL